MDRYRYTCAATSPRHIATDKFKHGSMARPIHRQHGLARPQPHFTTNLSYRKRFKRPDACAAILAAIPSPRASSSDPVQPKAMENGNPSTHSSNTVPELADDDVPANGDRIMILTARWLSMILDGQKTVEIRGQPVRPGIVWFGHKQLLHGSAYITHSEKLSLTSFRQMQHQHGQSTHVLPYKRTHALHMADIKRLRNPQPFFHPRGAIGWVKYRNRHQAGAPQTPRIQLKVPNAGPRNQRPPKNQAPGNHCQTNTNTTPAPRSQNESEPQDRTKPDTKPKKRKSRQKAAGN